MVEEGVFEVLHRQVGDFTVKDCSTLKMRIHFSFGRRNPSGPRFAHHPRDPIIYRVR